MTILILTINFMCNSSWYSIFFAGASVSGLNENDYPNIGDKQASRHLHTLKKVPLPADLLHHFQRILFYVYASLKAYDKVIYKKDSWCIRFAND